MYLYFAWNWLVHSLGISRRRSKSVRTTKPKEREKVIEMTGINEKHVGKSDLERKIVMEEVDLNKGGEEQKPEEKKELEEQILEGIDAKEEEAPENAVEGKDTKKEGATQKNKEGSKEIQNSGQIPQPPAGQTCRAFLEEADIVKYERDFNTKPIKIRRGAGARDDCPVPCHFIGGEADYVDAYDHGSRSEKDSATRPLRITRNMESATNYPSIELERAHANGYDIVQTTDLRSEVPVPYFSWREYLLMKPLEVEKTHDVAAFISNCGASNFRNGAVKKLQELGVKVDSYGSCMNNMPGGRSVNKAETIRKYKFTLAFENSCEPDYITEKYFQALEAGSVPVVIGATTTPDFQPSNNSIIYIPTLEDVPAAAQRIKRLLENDNEYQAMLSFKTQGPSDSFKALIDLAVMHSDCRLCTYVADRRREEEDKALKVDRPCRCQEAGEEQVMLHFYVRERGMFEFRSLFLPVDENFSLGLVRKEILAAFGSDYKPLWTRDRVSYREKLENGTWDPSDTGLRLHRIYPVGSNPRIALFDSTPWYPLPEKNSTADDAFFGWAKENPCGKLEVIFV